MNPTPENLRDKGYVEISPGNWQKPKFLPSVPHEPDVIKIKTKNENHIPTLPELSDSEQRERPQALARRDEGEAQGAGLLHCRFTLHRKSLLDVDAKYASVKDLLDCLVFSGVIPGDKEGQITLEVNQRKVKKGELEKTEIEVLIP